MPKPKLDIPSLVKEARTFAQAESAFAETTLFGVTDGKAVGTYLELKFRKHLVDRYTFEQGNAAKGIDFPDIGVDMKVTKADKPQSSSLYKSARQKVTGLGYALLVFGYKKTDDPAAKAAHLDLRNVVLVEARRTGDYQMTKRLRDAISNGADSDDLAGIIDEFNLIWDDGEPDQLIEELLKAPPEQGYLGMTSVPQWRLRYKRVFREAGVVDGIHRVK